MDFDGVIVDSNRLKYDAWFRVFPDSERIPETLIRDVLSRIRQTRYDILREIFIQTRKQSQDIEGLVTIYGARYNKIIQEAIAAGGLISGVKETLQALSERYALYINSATPQEALDEAVDRGGIKSSIVCAYGTPSTKEENLQIIMARESAATHEIMMVGDGEGDFAAAQSIGCPFVGISNEFNGWKYTEFPLIADLTKLPIFLSKTV